MKLFAKQKQTHRRRKQTYGDFSVGAVVKNPPAMQETWVQAMVWEDPTCRGTTKPVHHNY